MQNEVAPWNEHPASLREAVEHDLIEAYQRARTAEKLLRDVAGGVAA